jgi:hypothetical protein
MNIAHRQEGAVILPALTFCYFFVKKKVNRVFKNKEAK